MIEVIAWAPDLATLSKAANATGFVDKQVDPVTKKVIKQSIKTHGSWTGSKGGWFLAVVPQFMQPTGKMVEKQMEDTTIEVPEMAPVPGVWARLRWNDISLIDRFKQFLGAVKAQGITVYERFETDESVYWSHDGGTTVAPSYINNIGKIL
jgi:hypothetical protein